MKTKVLWAVKIGNPDWQEELITTNENLIGCATIWAKENGYNRLRIAVIDLSTTMNFTKSINI